LNVEEEEYELIEEGNKEDSQYGEGIFPIVGSVPVFKQNVLYPRIE